MSYRVLAMRFQKVLPGFRKNPNRPDAHPTAVWIVWSSWLGKGAKALEWINGYQRISVQFHNKITALTLSWQNMSRVSSQARRSTARLWKKACTLQYPDDKHHVLEDVLTCLFQRMLYLARFSDRRPTVR